MWRFGATTRGDGVQVGVAGERTCRAQALAVRSGPTSGSPRACGARRQEVQRGRVRARGVGQLGCTCPRTELMHESTEVHEGVVGPRVRKSGGQPDSHLASRASPCFHLPQAIRTRALEHGRAKAARTFAEASRATHQHASTPTTASRPRWGRAREVDCHPIEKPHLRLRCRTRTLAAGAALSRVGDDGASK